MDEIKGEVELLNIFKNGQRFNIRSVGLGKTSNVVIANKDIIWADTILVMEEEQKSRIRKQFRHLEIPKIEVLHIDDDYEYLDKELIELLRERINDIFDNNSQ